MEGIPERLAALACVFNAGHCYCPFKRLQTGVVPGECTGPAQIRGIEIAYSQKIEVQLQSRLDYLFT